MKLVIYIDGGARGNPGPAAIGVVAGQKSYQERIGNATNNVAEYMALIRGLEEAIDLGERSVEVFADSELIVKQIKGEYQVKNEGLTPLFYNVKSLIKKFKHFKIVHVPREENEHADELSSKGIDDHALKGSPLFGKI